MECCSVMQNLINMQISSIHSSPLSSQCPLAALPAADLSLAGTAWPDVLLVPLQLCAPTGSSVFCAGNQHSMTVNCTSN